MINSMINSVIHSVINSVIQFFAQDWHTLLDPALIVSAAILIALMGHFVVFRLLRRYALRTGSLLGQSLLKYGREPTRWVFPLLAVLTVLPSLSFLPIVMSNTSRASG
jgi:uncharacterized protein YybS (DUF2232 family)